MGLRIVFVGATGVVGVEFLKIIEHSSLPIQELRLTATKRSAGTKLKARGQTFTVVETTPEVFGGAHIAFVSATVDASRELVPQAVRAGAIAIDDSSAFRMEPHVPLVVPEINGDELAKHQGIVATPNCAIVPVVMALHALRRASPLRRVVVATYQSVSGAGAAAVRELTEQTRAVLSGGAAKPAASVHPIAFNVIPAIDAFTEDGYTKEEQKMAQESRKVLGLPELAFSATCVRVPVYQAHSMAVQAEFERAVSPAEARGLLAEMPGLRIVDDPAGSRYPTPLDAAGKDEVLVGRIRKDMSHPNGLAFWVSGDNLRKGAALNMVQIAGELVRRRLVKA